MKIREKPSYSTSYDTHTSDQHRGKYHIITQVVINLNPTNMRSIKTNSRHVCIYRDSIALNPHVKEITQIQIAQAQ